MAIAHWLSSRCASAVAVWCCLVLVVCVISSAGSSTVSAIHLQTTEAMVGMREWQESVVGLRRVLAFILTWTGRVSVLRCEVQPAAATRCPLPVMVAVHWQGACYLSLFISLFSFFTFRANQVRPFCASLSFFLLINKLKRLSATFMIYLCQCISGDLQCEHRPDVGSANFEKWDLGFRVHQPAAARCLPENSNFELILFSQNWKKFNWRKLENR